MTGEALLAAVRRGDYRAVRGWVPSAGAEQIKGVAKEASRLRRVFGAEPIGARGGDWEGELTEGHHDAAALVHLAALGAEKAATQGAVSQRVARDLPLVYPDDLEVFVRTWSQLYQRNPKNWDRNAHYAVMFEWVAAGLVEAPTDDGAVNLWLIRTLDLISPPARGRGEPAAPPLPTPQTCPDLWTVTLPRLFEAEVGKGHGAAAMDHTNGGLVHDLVLHLVRTGVWDRQETLERIEAALVAREEPFQRRWLQRLRESLGA